MSLANRSSVSFSRAFVGFVRVFFIGFDSNVHKVALFELDFFPFLVFEFVFDPNFLNIPARFRGPYPGSATRRKSFSVLLRAGNPSLCATNLRTTRGLAAALH